MQAALATALAHVEEHRAPAVGDRLRVPRADRLAVPEEDAALDLPRARVEQRRVVGGGEHPARGRPRLDPGGPGTVTHHAQRALGLGRADVERPGADLRPVAVGPGVDRHRPVALCFRQRIQQGAAQPHRATRLRPARMGGDRAGARPAGAAKRRHPPLAVPQILEPHVHPGRARVGGALPQAREHLPVEVQGGPHSAQPSALEPCQPHPGRMPALPREEGHQASSTRRGPQAHEAHAAQRSGQPDRRPPMTRVAAHPGPLADAREADAGSGASSLARGGDRQGERAVRVDRGRPGRATHRPPSKRKTPVLSFPCRSVPVSASQSVRFGPVASLASKSSWNRPGRVTSGCAEAAAGPATRVIAAASRATKTSRPSRPLRWWTPREIKRARVHREATPLACVPWTSRTRETMRRPRPTPRARPASR